MDEPEGWSSHPEDEVLRDTARKRPAMVYEWLLPRATRASGVTVREAVKYLPDDQRTAVLDRRARH